MKVKSKIDVVNRCQEWEMAIKKAEQKGRKEGRKIGITKEKFETAERLLNDNYSLDQVQRMTQLTFEQIKSCLDK